MFGFFKNIIVLLSGTRPILLIIVPIKLKCLIVHSENTYNVLKGKSDRQQRQITLQSLSFIEANMRVYTPIKLSSTLNSYSRSLH